MDGRTDRRMTDGQAARGKGRLHFEPGFSFFKVGLSTHKQEKRELGSPYVTICSCGNSGSPGQDRFPKGASRQGGPSHHSKALILASELPWVPQRPPSLV